MWKITNDVTGRMDYYLHVGTQIDLMKIDVEGHELSVVRRCAYLVIGIQCICVLVLLF